jgi:hypothetical protein
MSINPNSGGRIQADTGAESGVSIWTKGPISSNSSLTRLNFQVLAAQQNELTRALKIVRLPIDGYDMRVAARVRSSAYDPPANRFNISFT